MKANGGRKERKGAKVKRREEEQAEGRANGVKERLGGEAGSKFSWNEFGCEMRRGVKEMEEEECRGDMRREGWKQV